MRRIRVNTFVCLTAFFLYFSTTGYSLNVQCPDVDSLFFSHSNKRYEAFLSYGMPSSWRRLVSTTMATEGNDLRFIGADIQNVRSCHSLICQYSIYVEGNHTLLKLQPEFLAIPAKGNHLTEIESFELIPLQPEKTTDSFTRMNTEKGYYGEYFNCIATHEAGRDCLFLD